MKLHDDLLNAIYSLDEKQFPIGWVRLLNVLENNGICSFDDIAARSRSEMLALRHFGVKTMRILDAVMIANGVKFRSES